MSDTKDIRHDVSRAYAKAVSLPVKSGCCSGAATPGQKGVVVKFGGYEGKELASLPAEAVSNSFGCGNPVAFAEIAEGQVVLDLGSGAGIDLFLAAQKVGRHGRVIGVDMTDEMLAKARENIARGGYANVEVRKGFIEQLPVADASVDWVISNCVINLSPDKPAVFREIARVLKPGGRMLVSDIVASELTEEIKNDPALYCGCVSGAIDLERYLNGLREAGLAEVRVRDSLVYDAAQLEAFFLSELSEVQGCCGSVSSDPEKLRAAARSMVGRVQSVRVYGRKPLSSS